MKLADDSHEMSSHNILSEKQNKKKKEQQQQKKKKKKKKKKTVSSAVVAISALRVSPYDCSGQLNPNDNNLCEIEISIIHIPYLV